MNSTASCPKCSDGTIPVDIAPAEPDVGIMGPYLDNVGACDMCGYVPDLEEYTDEIAKIEDDAIEARYSGPEWDYEEDR